MSNPTPPRAPHRLARAVAATLLAVLAGVAGHRLAGGTVDPVAVAAAAIGWLGPAWLLAGRERGWTAIAAAQITAQQLVHVLLTVRDSEAGLVVGLIPHDVMLYAHVAAAAVVSGWLRSWERRACGLTREVARIVAGWLRQICFPWARPAPRLASAVRSGRRPRPASTFVLRHALVRRGPPQPA